MKYQIITNTNAGFFSNLRTTISTIHHCESNNIKPYIYWSNSIYNEPSYGENAWDYYFEQLYSKPPGGNYERAKHYYIKDKTILSSIINRITIKDHILDKVDKLNNNLVHKNSLGVHIRLTDKFTAGNPGDWDPIEGRPVSLEMYKYHISNYLDKNDNVNIIFCTDSHDAIEYITNNFDNIIYREDVIRGTGSLSVHHHLHNESNYKKGEDVLIDCLILSRCNHIIKGTSSVATCSMLFNPNLTCDNLNYMYNNDSRELWVES